MVQVSGSSRNAGYRRHRLKSATGGFWWDGTGWGTGKSPLPLPPLPTLERHRGFPRFITSLSSLIRCVTNNTLGGIGKDCGGGGRKRTGKRRDQTAKEVGENLPIVWPPRFPSSKWILILSGLFFVFSSVLPLAILCFPFFLFLSPTGSRHFAPPKVRKRGLLNPFIMCGNISFILSVLL